MMYSPLRLKTNQIIFQVGAFDGYDELIKICAEKKHHLYLFEPSPKRFLELSEKIKGHETVQAFPYAISNYDGTAEFHIANHEDCSSLSPFDPEVNRKWLHKWHRYGEFQMVDKVEVKVMRLDTFIEQQKIKWIDFLEIDTQGEDLRVVESLGDFIRHVKKIQIEVNIHDSPLYQNSFTKDDALAYLEKRQFAPHTSWKQSVNREENIIFVNLRYYPNATINRVSRTLEGLARNLYYSSLKIPTVLAVTRSMALREIKTTLAGKRKTEGTKS